MLTDISALGTRNISNAPALPTYRHPLTPKPPYLPSVAKGPAS